MGFMALLGGQGFEVGGEGIPVAAGVQPQSPLAQGRLVRVPAVVVPQPGILLDEVLELAGERDFHPAYFIKSSGRRVVWSALGCPAPIQNGAEAENVGLGHQGFAPAGGRAALRWRRPGPVPGWLIPNG